MRPFTKTKSQHWLPSPAQLCRWHSWHLDWQWHWGVIIGCGVDATVSRCVMRIENFNGLLICWVKTCKNLKSSVSLWRSVPTKSNSYSGEIYANFRSERKFKKKCSKERKSQKNLFKKIQNPYKKRFLSLNFLRCTFYGIFLYQTKNSSHVPMSSMHV